MCHTWCVYLAFKLLLGEVEMSLYLRTIESITCAEMMLCSAEHHSPTLPLHPKLYMLSPVKHVSADAGCDSS
jgi:hypothetical protein